MQKRTISKTRQRRGFTLIEVLVVLGIIVLLATMVGPRLLGTQEQSDIKATFAQIKTIEGIMDRYQLDMKRYPATDLGLTALVEEPGEDTEGAGNVDNWAGPYIKEIPQDPWGNDFQYEYESGDDAPKIWSFGPDGEDGTEDDITNGSSSGGDDEDSSDIDTTDI